MSEMKTLKEINRVNLHSPVTFFVGENGSGKSTLLEALATAYGFNPEGGTRNFLFSTKKTHSSLHKNITLERGIYRTSEGFFLRAESFYNVATEVENIAKKGLGDDSQSFLKSNYGGDLHKQSHGESFLALVMNRFKANSLFLLDEPEAALSPTRQLSLLALIDRLVKKNCQFIIATHSPILMAYPNSEILTFSEKGLVKTPYKETEHYLVTKRFLNNPQGMLQELFKDDE